MKKIICAATLLSGSVLAAHAQIAPGTLLVGGGVGYSYQARKGTLPYTDAAVRLEQNARLNISPTAAYFIADNLAVGLVAGYSANKKTNYEYSIALPVGGGKGNAVRTGETTVKDRTLNLGPVARYYVFMGDKAAFFGQLGASYQSLRLETTSSSNTSVPSGTPTVATGKGYAAQLAPGFAFFPTPKFGLEVSLQGLVYQHMKNELHAENAAGTPPDSRHSTSRRFDGNFGLNNLQLGASLYLGR